jgi:AcrR family transcriptional regulator
VKSQDSHENDKRARILDAAFAVFARKGYAAASTLEIATLARVSKRELYAIVGTKHALLVECIKGRSSRFRFPDALPDQIDAKALEKILLAFGSRLVTEISDPTVVAVFRLAIAEAVHAPEVAATLDAIGRETARSSLRAIMEKARKAKLVSGTAEELAELFAGLLWGNFMVSLLLGVAKRPSARAIEERARHATMAFMKAFAS